jgi:hypothetical protein
MSKVRKIIADAMETLGLNYAYLEWLDGPVDMYFTGEYQEGEALDESGQTEISFILTGFARGNIEALEEAKETIKQYFDPVSGMVIADKESAVAIFYAGSFPVRTMDAELKKIQINLNIKEWSVK